MEQNPLLIQRLVRWSARILRENRVSLISSLLFSLLAYTFAFTNKLPNHDEVGQLFAKGATVSSGRWGLGALDMIFPNYSMPWLYGIVTVVLIALSVCILLHLFSIRNPILQSLLCGCILVFPSLIGLFGYMFTSSSYAVSFLLAALSVYSIRQGKWYWAVLGTGFLVGSLSIYQAYLSIAASLLVLLLIYDLLQGADAPQVFRRGVFYVLCLLAALGLYYAATQAVLVLKDVPFNDYAADAVTFQLSSIPRGIAAAYGNFLRFFTDRSHGLIVTRSSKAAHLLLLAAAGILLLLWLRKQHKQDVSRIALLLLLLFLLPLAINCMYVITAPSSIHTLVLYSFVSLYLLTAILWEALFPCGDSGKLPELLRRLCLNAIPVSLAAIVCINTCIANESYLQMHLRYENAYGVYASLIATFREMPEFQEGYHIAVLGTYEEAPYYQENFSHLSELMGVNGFRPDDYCMGMFLRYYLGLESKFATAEEQAAILATDQFRQMPCYPYHGSVAVIQDTIVVKFSDVR